MNSIELDYAQSCGVSGKLLNETLQKLQAETSRIQNALKHEYDSVYASLSLPYDEKLITAVTIAVNEKKALNPTLVIIIGIGGSNLGTLAVIEAIYGKFYNLKTPYTFYYADTIDTDYLTIIMQQAEHELFSGNTILINVISKSGTTTETIVNFQLFFELLKKYRPNDYNNFIVITTDEGSALWNFANNERITTLTIPAYVGGRYSILSAVGLFPLALCGIDIKALQNGAQKALEDSLNNEKSHSSAAISAVILHALHQQGYVIHDTFLFSVELEGVGKWYRQLLAESIGKSHNKQGILINNGITPTVSIGSTDLHSVAQLYLSGPYNTFTSFVSVEKNNTNLCLSDELMLRSLAPNIQNKSTTTIMKALLDGTMTAYKKDNRPFVHIIIPEKNAYYMGYFMQIKMLEIIYLGFLMNINPFDQPNVELYKTETKKLLALKK